MTNRTCTKCGDTLTLNEKLNLMECVSGRHIEPVNLIRPQWWNKCPECGQMGTNDIDGERILQKFENNKPVFVKTKKGKSIVFEVNQSQISIICKACGYEFTKKSAFN